MEATAKKPVTSLVTDDKEDTDKWLEISPEELDEMLARSAAPARGGDDQSMGTEGMDTEDGKALGDLAKKVEEFVGGQGDMQGARFVE